MNDLQLYFNTLAKGGFQSCEIMAIDVQREYCDPTYDGTHDERRGTVETENVSAEIGRCIPQFRDLGVDISWIYSYQDSPLPRSPLKSFGGFHNVQIDRKRDRFFSKYEDSVFATGGIINQTLMLAGLSPLKTQYYKSLKRRNKSTLLVCGFNLSACVRSSVRDAMLQGFDIVMLEDLCANDRPNPSTKNGWIDFNEQIGKVRVQARFNKKYRLSRRGDVHIMPSRQALSFMQKGIYTPRA